MLSLLLAVLLASAALTLPGCGDSPSGNTLDSSESTSSGSDAGSSEIDSSGSDAASSEIDSSDSDAASSEIDSSGSDAASSKVDSSDSDAVSSEIDSSDSDAVSSEIDSSDSDADSISSVLIGDEVTSVEITSLNDTVMRCRTVTGKELSLLRDWANHLEYSEASEEEQENYTISGGGRAFQFRFKGTTGSTDWFSYLIHKTGAVYLSIGLKLYAVKNPSDPPVQVPEKPAVEISSTLIGDRVTGIEIAFYNRGGETSWTAAEEEITLLRDWANHLKYITLTEEEQRDIATATGGEGFHFTVQGEKTTEFTYLRGGYAYLRLGKELYAVTTPSDPPVTVPGRS